MTLKLWRPDRVEWGNRWGVEESINRVLAEGWRLQAVLPADPWSGEVPTFVLIHRRRWRDPHKVRGWQRIKLLWWYYIGRRISA